VAWQAGGAEPGCVLTAAELADRIRATYDCPHHRHLVTPPKKAASRNAT